MIISKVTGGIGNQMFQHAAGRALSLRLRDDLKVDARHHHLDGASHNGYELSRVFCVSSTLASESTVSDVLGWCRHRPVQRVLKKLKLRVGPYVVEPHFHHWKGFEGLTSPAYLDGYWQSPSYFSSFAGEIAADFAFRQSLQGENARIADLIRSHSLSVSLHVRRGDYVTNANSNAHHGTCPPSYYASAMERLNKECGGPARYFVFSDDVDWARANLSLPSSTCFVDHNKGNDSHFDMQLMSLCRHNVIANSSFSWWAAWLNRNEHRIVVAPRRWFLAPHDTTTLFPPDWLLL